MTEQLLVKAFKAKENLRKQTIVALDSEGKLKPAKLSADKAIGIALAGGNLKKDAFADALLMGIAEVKVGANVLHGDLLHWDEQSRVITATTGKAVIGIALDSAITADTIIRVLVQHGKA